MVGTMWCPTEGPLPRRTPTAAPTFQHQLFDTVASL